MRLVGNKLTLTVAEATALEKALWRVRLEAYIGQLKKTLKASRLLDEQELTLDVPLDSVTIPVNGYDYMCVKKDLEAYVGEPHSSAPGITKGKAYKPAPLPDDHGISEPFSALTIARMQKAQTDRSKKWLKDGEENWSILEWAGAMCGEAGEAANIAKKIRRHDQGLTQKTVKKDRSALVFGLGMELADIILYCCSMASDEGIDLEQAIVHKFNLTSEREGFPDKL